MLNEREIKTQARLAVLENLLSFYVAMQLVQSGFGDEAIDAMLKGLIEKMRAETFPGTDPATSDLLASEVEAATKDLTDVISARVAGIRLITGR